MHPVARVLEGELEAIRQLQVLLDVEQQALKEAAPERLNGIGQDKAVLIERLNQLEAERLALIPSAGPADPRRAMDRWLASQEAPENTRNLWNMLLELARQARTSNELNGKLVALHLQHTNQALSALSRQSTPGLYGSDGQTSTLTGSRIVDSA